MNNSYLYTQMFWTMFICIFIWICKGGEMKFHVPLKLMGFVYLTLLGCASKPVSFPFLRKGGIWFQKFLWPSVYFLLGVDRAPLFLEMQDDTLSIAINRRDRHCSKMKQPFQSLPRFIIKDFVLKLEFVFCLAFFGKELCLEAAALIYCDSCDFCLNFISAMKSRSSWNSCSFVEAFLASCNQVDISVKYFKCLERFRVVKLVVQISKIVFCHCPVQDC